MPKVNQREMNWALGKLLRAPDDVAELRQFRPVSDQEAEQLQSSARVVRELGSLRGFQSLLHAVERWLGSVERARDRLAAGNTVPSAVRISAALDLVAMKRASAGCVRQVITTTESLAAEGHADATHTQAVDDALRFLQTRQAYLIISGLSQAPSDAAIEFSLVDTAVQLYGVTAFSANALGYLLVAEVGQFTGITLAALAAAIAEPASQLAALLEEVPDDVIPDLVRVDGTSSPPGLTLTSLPIAQAVALRRFSQRLQTLPPDQFAEAAFEVINAGVQQQVAIGSVDVSTASANARASTAVNDMPHLNITVDVDLVGSAPIDYWSATTFNIIGEGTGQQLFAGAVQRASGGEPLALECEGAIELAEHNRGSLVAAGVDSAELVATIMRQIGLPEDTISFSAPEQSARHHERFDVLVPVRGLAVSDPVTIGRITMVPVSDGILPLDALDLTPEHVRSLEDEYRNATAYAVASVDADALDTAEDQGYAVIETTMAWLVARQRYGFLRLPDGSTQTFERERALQSARYGAVVLVRGKNTRRQWLRWIKDAGRPTASKLTTESDILYPALPDDLALADERALRALMRAVNEPGLQQQVQALSEALEAYVAGVELPELFSKQQREELRELAPGWLNSEQQHKFETAINTLNAPPFGARLSERLDRDGVPLTDVERRLLFGTLRAARNDVAHGRAVRKPPTRDEVLRGISVVSRALLFSITVKSQSCGGPATG
ncbi:MAG: hypothetical protein JWM60_1700 [Solirubrobacterales bacterium]|nr:hypothetical protein [Solirubrobacterales bacterium]